MKSLYHLFLILLIGIRPISTVRGETHDFCARELKQLVVGYPDSVISILDVMENTESKLPDYQVNLLKSLAYNEKRMFSLVEMYALRTLAADSIDSHRKEKLNAMTLLAVAQSYFGDFNRSIQTLAEAMELARASDNTAGELNILTTMAKTAFQMNDRSQGYDYIDRIISFESSDDVRVLANVSAAYGVKVIELYADNRFEDGLAEGKKRLALIDRIDHIGGAPDGYTDQQRAYTYARIASCAERAGHKSEANEAYRDFMGTDYARNPSGRVYIMDYLLDSGHWSEALEVTRPLYNMMAHSDTINDDYRSLLDCDAKAMAGLGQYRDAYFLMQRASAIKDSLNLRENSLRAQELATVFALNEKDIELVNTRAALHKRRILLFSSLGFTLLILIISLLIFRAYRISRRQQKIATTRIDELLAMNRIVPDAAPGQQDSFRDFMDMQNKIINGGLFKNPSFNRENIVECTGLSRSRVISLIDTFTGMTPGDYLNKLRVEHSLILIKEHPEWTIDAIAEECGYVRRATYYNHFVKIFGITPAKYRKEKIS